LYFLVYIQTTALAEVDVVSSCVNKSSIECAVAHFTVGSIDTAPGHLARPILHLAVMLALKFLGIPPQRQQLLEFDFDHP
jgi:hypothetical protein